MEFWSYLSTKLDKCSSVSTNTLAAPDERLSSLRAVKEAKAIAVRANMPVQLSRSVEYFRRSAEQRNSYAVR